MQLIQLRRIHLDDTDYPNQVVYSSMFGPETVKQNQTKLELESLLAIFFSDDTEYANQELGYRNRSSTDQIDSE